MYIACTYTQWHSLYVLCSHTYTLPRHTHTSTCTHNSQDIHTCFDSLLQRDIKLHFLQILAPGHVYPDRSVPHLPHCFSPQPSVEGSLYTVHSKKFDVEDLGLTWETVETIHWFIFPGMWGCGGCYVNGRCVRMWMWAREGVNEGVQWREDKTIQSDSSRFPALIVSGNCSLPASVMHSCKAVGTACV